MIGKFIGKLIAAPIRLANLPVRAFDAITDPGDGKRPFSKPIDDAADMAEKMAEYVFGDDD